MAGSWNAFESLSDAIGKLAEEMKRGQIVFERFVTANINALVYQMNGWNRFKYHFRSQHWQPLLTYIRNAVTELTLIIQQ